MSELLSFAAVGFSAIFFVVDPLGLVPIFLAVTQNEPPEKRHATALRAAVAATALLLAFAMGGAVIFEMFGITLGAFKIAGGLLLFLVALDMMRAQQSRVRTSPEEEQEGVAKDDVAIIPLAVPMMAGPGAIATVMVVMNDAGGDLVKSALVVGAVLATGGLSWAFLRSALWLEARLKVTGLAILNRVMGLILAAVAVQFVVDGVAAVLPQVLAGPQP